MLNEVKGNMYGWVTHTWNTIKGKCPRSKNQAEFKAIISNVNIA